MSQQTTPVSNKDYYITKYNHSEITPERVDSFNRLPEEVIVIIFKILAENGELWIRQVNTTWKGRADVAISYLWHEQLNRHEGTHFEILMNHARKKTEGESALSSYRYLNQYCYQGMLITFPSEKENSLPLTFEPDTVQALLGKWERIHEEDIVKMWPLIEDELDLPDFLTTASEINTFLRDPTNRSVLSQFNALSFWGLGIRLIPHEITFFTGIKCLDLGKNKLVSLPCELGQLTQLQKLKLFNNCLREIPRSFAQLTDLQKLNLYENQISQIPDFIGTLPRLTSLNLCSNRITHIPDSFQSPLTVFASLSDSELGIDLFGNPLLTFWDRHSLQRPKRGATFASGSDLGVILSEQKKCREYNCLSPFSALYKLLIIKQNIKMVPEDVKEAFQELSIPDQNLIFKMVCLESGSSIEQGENHVFDDWNIFCRAVREVVKTKFDDLSPNEKNKVYEKVYDMAKPQTDDHQWGKYHAFDNILLLIDAMADVTEAKKD